MRGPGTALGIDISNGRINLALLKRKGKGVKLVKAAAGPVPDGAIKDGNIENPALLAGAIKKLKAGRRIYSHHTALSLTADPVLVQILDLPKDRPSDVRNFVLDEVKHYAVLPIGKAAVDFWGIKTSGKPDSRRALVVATDGQKVADAAGAFNRKGLNIDAIEPAWVAYIRACYEKKIAGEFDTNLLFAIVHNGTATLCLFRDETLDFVRTKHIEPDASGSGDYFDWLAEEIGAIVRFYEFEVSDTPNKWKVTLVTDICDERIEEKAEQLRSKLDAVELEFRTLADAYSDTPVANAKRGIEPSAIAVGLAMKLLNVVDCGLNINLLPQQVTEAKSVEKQILVSANAAAIIFFLMVLVIGLLNTQVQKINGQIDWQKSMLAGRNIRTLKDEQIFLQGRFAQLSGKLNRLNTTLSTAAVIRWGRILDEISLATPENVQITDLSGREGLEMAVHGRALSHEDIHLFVDTLGACEHIESAWLLRAEKAGRTDALVTYIINCLLVQ